MLKCRQASRVSNNFWGFLLIKCNGMINKSLNTSSEGFFSLNQREFMLLFQLMKKSLFFSKKRQNNLIGFMNIQEVKEVT